MAIKKYFGEPPLREPKPFSAHFGVSDDEYDVDLIEDTKPVYYPSPQKLAEYEELHEGAGDRIIALAEAEQKQRHNWENRSLANHKSNIRFGQVVAALIFIILIVAVVYLSVNLIFIPAAALAIGGFFVFGMALRKPSSIAGNQRPQHHRFERRPRKRFRSRPQFRRH